MKWNVAQIPPEMALAYLHPIRALMGEEIFSDITLYTADDIIRGVMENRLALIVFYEDNQPPFLFAAIRLDTYPQGRIATIVAMAGRRIRVALEWNRSFEEWCRMQDCSHIYANVSGKLARILERQGYRSRSIAVYKPLMTIN